MNSKKLTALMLVCSFLSTGLLAQEKKSANRPVEVTRRDVFTSKWSYTPLIVTKDKNSQLERKFFKRDMWIKNTPITLAETSFVFLKNPQDEKNNENKIETLAKNINFALLNKLKITKKNNTISLEGEFEKTNRYMKINLSQKGRDFTIITTSIRMGFKRGILPEVNELHEKLLSYDGNLSSKKVTLNLMEAIFSQAHADSLGGMNLLELITTANSTVNSNVNTTTTTPGGMLFGDKFSNLENSLGGLQTTVGDLNTNLGTTNSTWSMTNDQFGVANNNWANSNAQFGNFNSTLGNITGEMGKIGADINTNWGNSNTQLGNLNTTLNNATGELSKVGNEFNSNLNNATTEFSKIGNDANSNWNNTNNQIDKTTTELGKKADDLNKNWDNSNKQIEKALETAKSYEAQAEKFNTNWAETNKLLAKTVDPNHMAKVAAYTAMGAALGGVAINLAMQGVVQGISVLHEMFTGEKKKKLEWSDFQKAMEIWDNQLNDLINMEKMVDGYLNAFAFFETNNLGNDYEKQLSLSMKDMKFDRDIFMEKFKDQNQALSCRKMYYDASLEIDGKIQEYDKIIKFASANNISLFGTNYFCNQLKDLQRRLLTAETQMQDVRLKILVAENQFYKKQKEVIEDRDKDMAKVNDRQKEANKEAQKAQKFADARMIQNNKSVQKAWVSQCVKGENATGADLKAGLSQKWFSVNYFKMKSGCKESFKSLTNKSIQKDLGREFSLELENAITKDLKLEANYQVDINLTQDQMSWMSKMHLDSFCFKYAHSKDSEIPAKCTEYPETLYSLSLSKGYDKARDAYENKCQERYIDGLERLSKSN